METQTTKIYNFIQNGRLDDAIEALLVFKNCLAKHSLLAYCYYHSTDYEKAREHYATCLSIEYKYTYKLYYTMCLYNLGDYDTAYQACTGLNEPQLMAAIKYEQGYPEMSLEHLEKAKNGMDVLYNKACLYLHQNKNKECLELLFDYKKKFGYKYDVSYVIGLAQYKLGSFEDALKTINEVILKGFQEHPEFQTTVENDVYLHNSDKLANTCLVEAHNLKACILQATKQDKLVKETINAIPRRLETHIDSITLHNMAVVQSVENPQESCIKLQHILSQPFVEVDEAFKNLLLLYIQQNNIALAADELAQHESLAKEVLDPMTKEYIEAVLQQLGSVTHCYETLDKLIKIEKERIKAQMTSKKSKSADINKFTLYVMEQGKLLWLQKNYSKLEQLLRQHADLLQQDSVDWKINLANCYFVQKKYNEAIPLYEVVVPLNKSIVGVLCVCYIFTNNNDKAEQVMTLLDDPVQAFHVDIIIATLYCCNSNYKYGISRLLDNSEPFEAKITLDTWFYIKRCFLSLLYKMATLQLFMDNSFTLDCINYLGRISELSIPIIKRESRLLQFAFLKLTA